MGNAYVNRHITGAIVGRQPFGGWKRSVVGPGAKAGGPNYVLQLCAVVDDGLPALGAEPAPEVRALLQALRCALPLSEAEGDALEAAARSDAHWWSTEFARRPRPGRPLLRSPTCCATGPLPGLTVRVGRGRSRAPAGPRPAGRGRDRRRSRGQRASRPRPRPALRSSTSCPAPPSSSSRRRTLRARLAPPAVGRVRLLGTEPELAPLEPDVHVDARPPVLLGRVELLRYLREQAVSRTLHRYGNVVRPFDEHRPAAHHGRTVEHLGRGRDAARRRATTVGSPRSSAADESAQASLTAVTSFCNVSLASPKSIVVFGS